MSKQQPHRVIRHLTLGANLTVIGGIVALLIGLHLARQGRPASVVVEPLLSQVRQAEGLFYLPVKVTNRGTQTLEDVSVELRLEDKQTARFTIRYLAGGEEETAVAAFASQPRAEGLCTSVTFLLP